MKPYILIFALLVSSALQAQKSTFQFTLQHEAKDLSLRGLCVVNEQVVWASGTQGTVLRTTNGGANWQKITLKGYEKFDFRDIHAFDSLKAIAINVGSPAYILSTQDGGKTWAKVYENTHEKAFLDDLAFTDAQNGIAFGDPDAAGKFLTLLTEDGGKSWKENNTFFPAPKEQEGGFAASGSILQYQGNKIWLATGGGVQSRLFYSTNKGKTWQIQATPILAGKEAQGIFSLAVGKGKNWVAVGGDYSQANQSTKTAIYTHDAGKTWQVSTQTPQGYRSGAAYAKGSIFMCVGTSGSDVSMDNGKTWQSLNTFNLNAIRFVKNSTTGWAVGRDGQIYKIGE